MAVVRKAVRVPVSLAVNPADPVAPRAVAVRRIKALGILGYPDNKVSSGATGAVDLLATEPTMAVWAASVADSSIILSVTASTSRASTSSTAVGSAAHMAATAVAVGAVTTGISSNHDSASQVE